jgi:hypothetical protein
MPSAVAIPERRRAPMVRGDRLATSRDTIAAVLLLVPAFFLRIFIGTDASSYADYPGVSLSFLGYLCHVLLIAYALVSGVLWPSVGQLAAFGVLFVVSTIQLMNLDSHAIVSAGEAMLPLGRGFLWLGAIWSFLALTRSTWALVDVFIRFAKFTAVAVIVCLSFYMVTDVAFGVYIAKGVPRAHAFLTEPSGVAYVVPALGALMLYQRRTGWFLLSAVSALASMSVLTIVIFLVMALLAWLVRLQLPRVAAASVIVVAVLTAFGPPLLGTEVGREVVSSVANSAERRLADLDTDNVVINGVFGRLLVAAVDLDRQLSERTSDDELGSLARLFGMIKVFDELYEASASLLGFGVNVYGYVQTRYHAEALLDFGYPSFLFSSFGVMLGSLVLCLTLHTITHCLHARPAFGLFLTGFVVATLANSAAGIHAYALPMLAALIPIAGRHLFAAADTRRADIAGVAEAIR